MNETDVSSPSSSGNSLPDAMRYVTAALLTSTCVLGLTGYSVMIYVIAKTDNIGGTVHARLSGGSDGGNRLMLVSSYVAGLVGSGSAIPVYVANISGRRLVVPVLMCRVFGFVNVVTFNALLSTSVAMVIRQCLLVVTKGHGRYSERKTLAIVALSWLVPLAMGLGVWRYVGFNPNLLNCLFEDTHHVTPPVVPLVVIATPAIFSVATILVCYALLFRASKLKRTVDVKESTVATVTGGGTDSSGAAISPKSRWTRTDARRMKLALKLIANWTIFAVVWLPLSCMFIADTFTPISPTAWMAGSLIARMFYGTGWLVFGIWNERLRHTLKMVVCRRRKVVPVARMKLEQRSQTSGTANNSCA